MTMATTGRATPEPDPRLHIHGTSSPSFC
jgi:hypothetical protein